MKITSVEFKKSLVELTQEFHPTKDLIGKPQVFFLGRSNVGKSSMINALFNKKELARTSAQAGKTRTINVFEVNGKFECLDFPGYGFAKGGKENMEYLRDMIVDYLESSAHNDVTIVQVIDAYVGPTDLDREVFDYLWGKSTRLILVLNKADKANQKELQATKSAVERDFGGVPYVVFSCKDKKYQAGALEQIFSL